MANEIERQTLNLFAMGIREFVGAFSNQNEANPGRLLTAMFLFVVAFLFVGVEALKILFRRNFSSETVSIGQIIIASLAFMGWGYLCFHLEDQGSNNETYVGLTTVGWFYLIFGFIVLARGIFEWQKSYDKKNGTLLGESMLLGFLKNSWWNEYRLKMIAEPLTVFAIALPLTAMNFYLGTPLVFCGISQIIFNLIFAIKRVEEIPDNSGSSINQVSRRNTVE